MINTNNLYSVENKKSVLIEMRFIQGMHAVLSDEPPSWNDGSHNRFFINKGDEVPYLWVLDKISKIPLAENQ